MLLRNPAVLGKPLTPADPVKVCEEFRRTVGPLGRQRRAILTL